MDLVDNAASFPPAVHELGINEQVLGGPGGNDNVPHQQLADRTAWLKAQVDALQATGVVHAADITAAINGHLAATDPHPQYMTQAEVDAAIAAQVNGHLAATDPHPQYMTQAEADAAIAAQPHQPLLTNADAMATAQNMSGIDADTITASGLYSGHGANWPITAAAQWQYMTVIRYTEPTVVWCVQMVQDFYSDRTWQRRCIKNVWQPWVNTSGHNVAGTVIAQANATVPAGYFECNGAVVSRTVYSDLFAAIGITYGGGDGTTTFALPDLRGEFVRGWDHWRGVDAGRGLGSWQADMLASHTHSYNHANGGGALTNGAQWGWNLGAYTTGATGGTETRPRNVAMMYCIKY